MIDTSSNPLSCLVKAAALIFVLLFVVITPLILLVFNVELLLFKPDLYKEALLEQGFYERLPDLVGEQLVRGMTNNPCEADPDMCEGEGQASLDAEEEGGPPAYMAMFDEEDWAYLMGSLFPQSWLQAQTEAVIDQIFTYLDGDGEELVLKISMSEFTQNLDQKKDEIILKLLEDSPPCTEEQLVEIAVLLLDSEETQVPVCKPPEELITPLMGEMDVVLDAMLPDVPDEMTFTPFDFSGEDDGEEPDPRPFDLLGDNPLAVLRFLRQGFLFSPLLSLALLALIATFGIRSFRGLLRWWGIPLLLAGMLAILPAFSAIPILNWVYETFLMSRIPGYLTQDMAGVFLDILRSIEGRLALWIGLQAGLMGMMGFFLVVISLFLKEKK
ncbi:MAG: hypothetical protein MUO76_20495 [Anaerolineaceae bacterium]|nr:hypothetical protein [Anaerolineaceae bacterium]